MNVLEFDNHLLSAIILQKLIELQAFQTTEQYPPSLSTLLLSILI